MPRRWPGCTVVCLGTGPSLTREDVERCRPYRVIAVNDAYTLAPWADVLYACDRKWWRWHDGAPGFEGLKFMLQPSCGDYPDVQALKNTGTHGLELDPGGVRRGHNSGYQAINVAVHLGAARILLLGYDMQTGPHGDHYFGAHRDHTKPPFARCLQAFPTLIEGLAGLGVDIVNCSRQTALHCFPRATLESVLPC